MLITGLKWWKTVLLYNIWSDTCFWKNMKKNLISYKYLDLSYEKRFILYVDNTLF